MIAHEIRLSSDTSRVIGWLDLDKDSREFASITIPVWTDDGLCALVVPFKTIEPNRCLVADPESLAFLRQLKCFRPQG